MRLSALTINAHLFRWPMIAAVALDVSGSIETKKWARWIKILNKAVRGNDGPEEQQVCYAEIPLKVK